MLRRIAIGFSKRLLQLLLLRQHCPYLHAGQGFQLCQHIGRHRIGCCHHKTFLFKSHGKNPVPHGKGRLNHGGCLAVSPERAERRHLHMVPGSRAGQKSCLCNITELCQYFLNGAVRPSLLKTHGAVQLSPGQISPVNQHVFYGYFIWHCCLLSLPYGILSPDSRLL